MAPQIKAATATIGAALVAVILVAGFVLGGASVSSAATASADGTASTAGKASGAMDFKGSISRIDRKLRKEMTGVSWHEGCPVPLRDLRLVEVRIRGFDGKVRPGKLVVNEDQARKILRVMKRLFELDYPIRRMHLVDAYGADDHRSMNADNTSAFNCRFVSGSNRWSEHAYGRAIDLNPVENPWVSGTGRVSPPAGRPFARRSPRQKGMVSRHGAVVETFARAGWAWGGDWFGDKDYQHFSASGS